MAIGEIGMQLFFVVETIFFRGGRAQIHTTYPEGRGLILLKSGKGREGDESRRG